MRTLVAKWAVPVLVATAITAALFTLACAKVSAATGWMSDEVRVTSDERGGAEW